MDGNRCYLTKEGLGKLQKELEQLKKMKKWKMKDSNPNLSISQEIDSEYLSFGDDIIAIESRIEELEEILKNYELIQPKRGKRKVVDMGATVKVEVEGQIDEFTIVGPLEANPFLGKVSHESPVGRALLGKRTGDEVRVQSAVVTIYKIKKIVYRI